jgi:hypothetical protein
MAGETVNPLGDLFVSLAPTIAEVRRWGGCYQYQQGVIRNLIEEFGLEINILIQRPPRARFQLNSGTTPFPRPITSPDVGPAQAGESHPLGLCLHLGYVSDFLIVRGVHQYLTGPLGWKCRRRVGDFFPPKRQTCRHVGAMSPTRHRPCWRHCTVSACRTSCWCCVGLRKL